MIRKRLFTRLQTLAVTCCLAAALTACHSGSVVAAPGFDADSLIVGLDDVQRIADRDDLTSLPVQDAPTSHYESPYTPDQCHPVFGQEDAFGHNWSQFRAVTYTAAGGEIKTMSTVTQAVGIYSDDGMARAEFDRLVSASEACAALQEKLYNFRVNKQGPSTVALVFPGNSQSVIYHVASSVLMDVVVQGLPRSDQIAETVTQMIAGRVK